MRLFVAINLSPGMREALTGLQEAMRASGVTGNFSPEENLHLTLAFLGERPEAESALEALETVRFTPFPLTLSGIGSFGDLWWVGVDGSQALEAVARRVRRALAGRSIPFDKKKFLPHITLVRKAGMPRPAGWTVPPVTMTADAISLMRSDRGKHGMIYTELGRVTAED